MKIYVDKLPKDCSECPLCMNGQVKLQKNGRYIDAKGCVLGDFYKYRTIDDDIDSCPLGIIKDKSNQKAIECLSGLNNELTDIIITETKDVFDFEFGQILESISAKFGQLIDTKIKELEEGK